MNDTQENGIQIEGMISLSTKGIGYVRNKEYPQGIEIEKTNLNTALHGDIVKVKIFSEKEGFQNSGEVIEIARRSKHGFSGIIEEDKGTYFLVPSDIKMYTDILIPKEKLNGAEKGQKVFGVITEWKDKNKSPLGEVVTVLGKPHENDAEMMGIALEKGFVYSFPPKVDKEAENIKKRGITEEDKKDRRDFRNTTTFTIDPFDAKDFDDALSFKETTDGMYEIGIHIADVSFYVKNGTALDDEALKRATSVYLVDRTIPMLPEILSNDLCSLKPNEDRLSFSAVFVIDKNGKVHDEWYGRTIIHSQKRFTYEDAQKILDEKTGEYYHELSTLNTLAKVLLKKRFDEGAISLEQDEVKFTLDEKGRPISVYVKVRGDTHKLIEEFMLLANRKVAEYVAKKDNEKEKVFLYRIHDAPDREKLDDLILYLKKLGHILPKNEDGSISSKEINLLIEKIGGSEKKEMIQTAIIRSMAKAIYSTKNIGHFGLGFDYYTHFTSPIRRYPDVVVHRILDLYLKEQSIPKEMWASYELIATTSSYREKEASEAERASIKYKQVEYMSERVGQIFEGVISGISKWGIFVEEIETRCEGMVRLKDIGNDFYEFSEKELHIRGQKTGKVFQVGDRVKIKVENADIDKKVIDYIFV